MSKRPSMAELRAKVKQKTEGKKDFNNTNSDVFPHWNIPEGSTAIVRILPDKNEENENYFYIDKLEHKLSINGKDRKIPCIKMWGEKCPICELSAKYYKAEGNKSANGKYYYFKRTSLMKALIIKDPTDYSKGGESAEGQVKTLQFTYQLMNLINTALANDEEETALAELPWDMDAGYNFLIKKTKQGEYDNYNTGSGFSNKVSSVPEKWREVADEGLVDLSTLLPQNPGLEKVQALLEAHLGGGEDPEEEGEEEKPVVSKRSRVVEDADEEEAPVRKRRQTVEDETEEEETPVIKKRRPVAEDAEEEEAPVVKKRRQVVEEEEEEEAPVVKKRRQTVEDESEEEDEDDSEIMKRIRARKRNTSQDSE